MGLRAALGPLGLVLLAACGGSSDPASDLALPRVILISCDTLRADRLGVYGYERDVSPNLDALAREGVLFEEAYACAPMTQPAVAALLSGKLPIEVGAAPGNLRRMPAEIDTLAERLQRAGYATSAIIANWILRREGGDSAHGVAQGFDHFDDEMPREKRVVPEKRGIETTDAALDWLDDRDSDSFFLWVHYQDPHGPYTPPPVFQRRFETPGGVDPPVPLGMSKIGLGQIPGYQRLGEEQDPAVYRDRYDAEISFFDREVGRLLDRLREEGLLDDSLLVFTADHGEALGEHDYWFCHGETVYREVVRVPLLVRWPGGRVPESFGAAGADGVRRCTRVASHLDVVPTVLAATGLSGSGLRGVSLHAGPPPPERVVAQNLWPSEDRPRWLGASDGRYRLVWSDLDPTQRLFDIQADPYESQDLAPELPDVATRLRAAHDEVMRTATKPAVDGSEIDLDDEALEALRALGYAGDGDE